MSVRLPISPDPDQEPRDAGRSASAPSPQRPELRDEDLHDLLVAFYDVVERDPLLAPYFAPIDMMAHMPRIVDFWSTLIFHTGRYSGNAFKPHLEMEGLTGEHFTRWLAALESTVRSRFAGPAAEHMCAMAHRIATSMQLRLGTAPFGEASPPD